MEVSLTFPLSLQWYALLRIYSLMSETRSRLNRTPESATSIVKFHASLNVSNLARSVEFYTALLGQDPVKLYTDYAKYELEVPPLVLSLKPKRACAGGPLNHLGMRLVEAGQLDAVRERLRKVGARFGEQDDVKCCYARQTKLWITDPDETLWEVYVLHEDVPDWGEKHRKIKLLAAPFQAFGIRGFIRRTWMNTFGPRPQPGGAIEPEEEGALDSREPRGACSMKR